MFVQVHYKKCYVLLTQLIEKYTNKYKDVVNSKKLIGRVKNDGYQKYKDGFDPDEYRNNLIKRISSFNDFNQFYSQITSGQYRENYSLFGKEFHVDIKDSLLYILNLSLMMYETINRFDLIEERFKDLYYSVYAEKFSIEVETIIENLDSAEFELLNKHNLSISIKKNPGMQYTSINYKITGTKNIKNPLEYPHTIIDIVMGILRVYISPKINYFINNVNYSSGCPEFMKTESSLIPYMGFKDKYSIHTQELYAIKNLFQRVYLHEKKVAMAFQRFSLACGRESDYDKLLDLVFTLELLFGRGEPDSIKHKILTRLINLRSSQTDVRQTLYQKMSNLYQARSIIVHGQGNPTKLDLVFKNLFNYEEIIRKAIIVFMEAMSTKKLNYEQVIEKLDYDKSTIYEIDISSIDWKR
jgi:hypothetical protein